MPQPIFQRRSFVLALIFLNSGIFFLIDSKRAGVPYLRELFIAVLFFVTIYLLANDKKKISFVSGFVFAFPIVASLFSSVLAYISWGQPIFYGLFEERRLYLYWIYFPVYYGLVNSSVNLSDIEKWVIYGALASAVVGFMYYLDVIPPNPDYDFKVDRYSVEGSLDPRAASRFPVGSLYVSLGILISGYYLAQAKYVFSRDGFRWTGVLFFLCAYLWFVIQTRSVMLLLAVGLLFSFRKKLDKVVLIIPFVFMLFLFVALFVPDYFDAQLAKLYYLIDDALNSGYSVRDATIDIIISSLNDNYWLGFGALSNQWNEGFFRIYNDNFYLSDVGVYGVLYRYGVFGLFLVLCYAVIVLPKVWLLRSSALGYSLVFMIFSSMVNFIYSNMIMYGGAAVGVALALYAGKSNAIK